MPLQPFIFCTERRLVALTGLRATNLPELLSILRDVPGSSIFYHTHHMYLSHHFERSQFTNDFALWVGEALQEDALSEKLAALDLLSFTSIRSVREAIIAVVEDHLNGLPARQSAFPRLCPAGDEFHFCRSMSFVMSTGSVARSVPEFFDLLPHVSNVSLFFHFFEARLRLGRPTNDFSVWLASAGLTELAATIYGLNPYDSTLDEFRQRLVALPHAA